MSTLKVNSAFISFTSSVPKTSHYNNRWNAVDIGFFDFHYDDKTAIIASVIEHAKKNIYFKDVHVFIKRVKDIIIMKKDESIKNNLYNCLRGIVLKWYIFILTKEQKFYVKHNENIDYWIKILLKRWKEFFFIVLITVIKKRYIMNDARRRCELNKYTQIIIRAARSTEIFNYNQIYLIYNDLNLEFRRDLHTSFNIINMHSFLNEFKKKKKFNELLMLEIMIMFMHKLKIKNLRKASIVLLTISNLMIKINIIKKVIETITMTTKRFMITSHRRQRKISFLRFINIARVNIHYIKIVFILLYNNN